MRKFLRNLKGVLTIAGCAVNTVFCIGPLILLAVFKLLIPITKFRNLMTRGIMAIGELWIDVNARIFATVNSTCWHIRGLENLSPDKWYLMIANHQTWVDIIALQTQLNRRIPFLKFFIKQELIWFPLLGAAWWAMDMPFMKRYSKSYLAKYPDKKGKDLAATQKACQRFSNTPTTVINFVEGTRFSELKKARRRSPFENLLPPRAGGVALALSSMGEMFDAILDVTIVYPGNDPPQFWEMCCGEFGEIVIDIRQRPIDDWIVSGDYSNDREYRRNFHRWLSIVWQDKDRKISTIRSEFSA